MSDHNLDLDKLAKLARLSINDAERAALVAQLNDILTFVDELSAIDTDGVEPMTHAVNCEPRVRPDVVTETDQRDRFLALAPAADDGHFLVPKVVE